MVQFFSSHERKSLFIALIAAAFSFVFFHLALFQEVDSNIFTALFSTGVPIEPSQFNGVAGIILAKLLQFIGDPTLIVRLLTALLSGLLVLALSKLFREDLRGIAYILCSIGFLFFAVHSPASMLTLFWVAGLLLAMREGKLQFAALLAGMGFGIDQLLSVAFGLYIIWLGSITYKQVGAALRETALVLLGIGTWVLLAWMLFGSAGLLTAIASGFYDLFTRINPLNFGVAVLVVFNILLIHFFRIKTERSRLPYLGSWLIALFLFVRSEQLYVLILLLVGVCYLMEIDKTFSRDKLLPVFAVVKLGLFFLLPSIEPLASRYLPREAQASDAETYLNSYFAVHMPSFVSLGEKESKVTAGRKLLAETDSGSAIVLDPITDSWFKQSAISAGYNDRFVGRYENARKRFISGVRDTSLIDPVRAATAHYFIGTKDSPHTLTQNLGKIREIDGLTLYSIDSAKLNAFFDAYIYHYFTSYH